MFPSPKCFSRTVSANSVPQLTSCLAEAPVAACSHGAQACPMLGCAHCRFCLAKRSSSKGVVCFWLCGAYIHWMVVYVRSCVDAIFHWKLTTCAPTRQGWTSVCFHGCLEENDEEDLDCEYYEEGLLLDVTSSFGQKPWTWEIAFEDVAPCMTWNMIQ